MKVIIIGITHHNTLSMIRCFGQKGVKVDVILYGDTEGSYIAKSTYINCIHFVDIAEDAIRKLTATYGHGDERHIVISSSDEIASLLDQNYHSLSRQFWFFNCGTQRYLTSLMNKYTQTDLAAKVGFDVPQSKVCSKNESYIDFYPCILKPLESIHGGKKIYICDDERSLNESLISFHDDEQIIAQKLINKEAEFVVVGLRVNNETIIPAYIEKHRETRGATSYSTVKRIEGLPNIVVNSSIRLVEEMNYEGLFGIELMLQDGKYYFCEINLRNDATTYAVSVAGVNLPYIYMLAKQDSNYSNALREIRELDSMVELNDFRNVLKRKVSPIKWWKEYKKCVCLYFKDPNDMAPYYCMRKEFCKSIIKKILHHDYNS